MPIAALAGLGAVVDAILAVVVLLAIIGIAYLVERFGQYIPLIGGWLAAQAVKFMQAAQSGLAYFYKAELWALNTVVDAVVVGVTYPLGKVLDLANVSVNALYWLRNVYVPLWTNYAINFANQVATLAYGYAATLYNQAIQFADQVALAAYAYALALYNQAIAYASAVLQAGYGFTIAVRNELLSDLGSLEAGIGADLAALGTFVGAEFALAEQYAQGLVQAAVGALESEIATVEARLTALIQAYVAAAEKDVITMVDGAAVIALTDIWPELATDIDAILHDIPQELTDLRDELASIPRVIPAGLLEALAALGALSIPLLRYLRECGIPMCKNLHGLSDLFDDLLSAGTDLALLDLVATAAHSPRQAAALIMDTLAPIAHDAATLTRELIGV